MNNLPINSFLFFGCWNKGLCKEETSTDLFKTITSMQTFLTETEPNATNKPDILIVAGDNYYADKEKNKTTGKKTKTINNEYLNSGFECLDTIPLPKYIIYGNHDVENSILPSNPTASCPIVNLEKEKQNKNTSFFDFNNDILPHMIQKNTLIVMIDSTLYDIDAKDAEEKYDCYKQFYDDQHQLQMTNIDDIITHQTTRALGLINKIKTENHNPIKNIIFIAHHPIFGVVLKKEKLKNQYYPKLIELEMLFCNEFKTTANFFHFCADIHQFQHSVVTFENGIEIKQLIVGTGGAEKDPEIPGSFPIKIKTTEKEPDVSKVVLYNSLSINGFMECNIINDVVMCIFHQNGTVPIQINFETSLLKKQSSNNKTQKKRQKKTKRMTRSVSPNKRGRSRSPKTRKQKSLSPVSQRFSEFIENRNSKIVRNLTKKNTKIE